MSWQCWIWKFDNRGNFLELLKFLVDHNSDIKAITISADAIETASDSIGEMGDALFLTLIDESSDILTK